VVLRKFDNNLNASPELVNYLLRDFLEEFFNNLADYSIKFESRDSVSVGKKIYDSLNSYTPLRNDFITFFNRIIKIGYRFDIDILVNFLEKLTLLKAPLDDRSSWTNAEFDNFRFIIHELFLSIVAVCLRNENYQLLEDLFHSSYFFQSKYEHKNGPQRFENFYNYVDAMDVYYRQTFSKEYISPMADFILKRIPEEFAQSDLINADLLCHYIASINKLRWFPITYIYQTQTVGFSLFNRLISLRHFEKMKVLFDVKSVEELKIKLRELKEQSKNERLIRYSNSFDSVTPIYDLINIDAIGSVR
jgi:hypothetical protein